MTSRWGLGEPSQVHRTNLIFLLGERRRWGGEKRRRSVADLSFINQNHTLPKCVTSPQANPSQRLQGKIAMSSTSDMLQPVNQWVGPCQKAVAH